MSVEKGRRESQKMIQIEPSVSEETLEEIRSSFTGRLLAKKGERGIYLYDRIARMYCLLSWQALAHLQQEEPARQHLPNP